MMSNSPGTIQMDTVGPGAEPPYNSFLPSANYSSTNVHLSDPERTLPTHSSEPTRPKPPRFEGFVQAYDAVSWICGFKEKYSLALRAY